MKVDEFLRTKGIDHYEHVSHKAISKCTRDVKIEMKDWLLIIYL